MSGRWGIYHRLAPLGRLSLPFLPHAHVDVDRAALEAKDLSKAPRDEPTVLGIEEPGREQHECRRATRRLGTEQDARLFATAHRVRVLGSELGEQRVELASRDAGVPGFESKLERRNQLLHVSA